MNRRKPYALPAAALVVLALAGLPCWGEDQPVPVPTVSLEGYQSTLRQWSSQVGQISSDSSVADKLRKSLPASIRVNTGTTEIESSTAWLDAALENIQKTKPEQRAALIKKILERLNAIEQAAQQSTEPSLSGPQAQTKLKEILARGEFNSVRGPSAWDLLQARSMRWLFNILDKIFGRVAAPAQIGQLLVWILIALAAAMLAVWLKRKLKTAVQDVRREPLRFAPPSSKSSRKWLAEAQAAALEGRWRDAIHLAYWAGIARLEENGAWVPDRARTPREYLRLLPDRNQHRPALAELTQKFEIIWYGDRQANSTDFQHVVAQLERMQCRL